MFLWILLAIVVALLIICVCRALTLKGARPQTDYKPRELDAERIANNLAGAIRIPTVTARLTQNTDFTQFDRLREYLAETYPRVHAAMEAELIDTYALVLRWKGADAAKLPAMFMAHQDVVPGGDETIWKYPPFSGEIAEGYVWGRGALDMKCQLISILEAAETLLSEGFKPGRDIYLVFNYNEESANETGSREIARIFAERGMRFEYVVDEGGAVISGKQFTIDGDIALIGVSEKGYADIEISCESAGGHASMPPENTALGSLAEAVCRLERWPMKARIAGAIDMMLKELAPHMAFPMKLIMGNLWLFKPLVKNILERDPKMNAMIRTTFAATMAEASASSNVLPQRAWANINCRIATWDTVESVKAHIEEAIGQNAKVTNITGNNAAPLTPMNETYRLVAGALSETLGGVLVAPFLMLGATDSRFMCKLSDNVLRVLPVLSVAQDVGTLHANNERIAIDSLKRSVEFFIRLIEKS